jgi:predicted metalloendopeptidase
VDPSDYFGNALRAFDPARRRELRRLMEGTPKTTWYEGLAPTDINAFYIPSFNQFGKLVNIVIILQISPYQALNSSQYFLLEYFDTPSLLQTGLSKLMVATNSIIA